MKAQAEKPQENKGHSQVNTVTQKQSDHEFSYQFEDNQPESAEQQTLQKVANNSPQVKNTTQLQTKADIYTAQQQQPIQLQKNNTGLPDNLKSGIENLSGYSMDDVKVHRNSSKPAQLQAHAYAQGTDIHLAPGQEKHLPHEAWHVVQQKQGRVKPTIQMKGVVHVNDNSGLEQEADKMGTLALDHATDLKSQNLQHSSLPTHYPIQRYVILGREKSPTLAVFSGPTMRRQLTMEDFPEVFSDVMKYLTNMHITDVDETQGLSAHNVGKWKGVSDHAITSEGRAMIEAKLKEWIGSSGMLASSTMGLDKTANWKEFDDIEELALALAHETSKAYVNNTVTEQLVAGAVNESEWIRQQLDSLMLKIDNYMNTEVSTFRYYADYVERRMFGSYNWAGKVTSLFSFFKSSSPSSQQAISKTKQGITNSITFLHDLMERWSSSGAGSFAAKIHETIGVEDVLDGAQDDAYESTQLDESSSSFTKKGAHIGLVRKTKDVSQDEHDEVAFGINMKRAIRAAEKSLDDINEVRRLQANMKKHHENGKLTPELKERYLAAIKKIQARIENRKARLASDGHTHLSFNDNSVSQETIGKRAELGKSLPQSSLTKPLLEARAQREKDKLKKVKVGAVDKSSKSKGRRNVGTRLERNPDTLLARYFSAPIGAGRSMTTARMMQLVEKVGGTDEEKTAVAHALFAYWNQTYNKGLTPVHTYVETMDVARNFGVPYKPYHYPSAKDGQEIDFMNPKAFISMSKGDVPETNLLRNTPFGLDSARWNSFKAMLDQVQRQADVPVDFEEHAPQDSNPSNQYIGASSSKKSTKAKKAKIDTSLIRKIPNRGGGDCLFYALEGRDLNPRQMLLLRRQIADERLGMPENTALNANQMVAGLLQTPGTNEMATNLMTGRHNIPNDVYAEMQAIPGMYAGDDELIQWCRVYNKVVGVVNANGELAIYTKNGRRRINYNEANQAQMLRLVLTQTDFALFKSPGHWERIAGIGKHTTEKSLVLSPSKPIHSMSAEIKSAFKFMGLKVGDFGAIRMQYHRLALRLHPDRNPDQVKLMTQRFQELQRAKELLDNIDEESQKKIKLLK